MCLELAQHVYNAATLAGNVAEEIIITQVHRVLNILCLCMCVCVHACMGVCEYSVILVYKTFSVCCFFFLLTFFNFRTYVPYSNFWKFF